jgi:hypothetical protein
LTNPKAAPTPFALPQYQVAELQRAAQLEQHADAFAVTARRANERGDNYMLMTILFALVLVLVGIGSKMDTFRARAFLFTAATLVLVGAAIVVFSLPVQI